MKQTLKNFQDFQWPTCDTISLEFQGLESLFPNSRTCKRYMNPGYPFPMRPMKWTLHVCHAYDWSCIHKTGHKLVFVSVQLITTGQPLINNFSCTQEWLHEKVCTSAIRRGAPLSCHVCTKENNYKPQVRPVHFFVAFLSSNIAN